MVGGGGEGVLWHVPIWQQIKRSLILWHVMSPSLIQHDNIFNVQKYLMITLISLCITKRSINHLLH
jgi:hypothetical protein